MNSLIPHVSTHFKPVDTKGYFFVDVTLGRIYKIKEWISEEHISFADDVGHLRKWVIRNSTALEDASFEYNLKEILK